MVRPAMGRPVKDGSLTHRLLDAERRFCHFTGLPALDPRTASRWARMLWMLDHLAKHERTFGTVPHRDHYAGWGVVRSLRKIEECLELIATSKAV